MPRYIVAGGTDIKTGEPVHNTGSTLTSGATDVNTMVLAAADTPVIGTHNWGGIANKDSKNAAAGTVLEQWLPVAIPVPHIGRIRGHAKVSLSVDTLTELALIVGDKSLIYYNATGGADGGEAYSIYNVASADVNGLTIVGGNTALNSLDAIVDARAYAKDITN